MELLEAKQKIDEVEDKISVFVGEELNRLMKETGLGIKSVNITLTDLSAFGTDGEKPFVLVATNIDICF